MLPHARAFTYKSVFRPTSRTEDQPPLGQSSSSLTLGTAVSPHSSAHPGIYNGPRYIDRHRARRHRYHRDSQSSTGRPTRSSAREQRIAATRRIGRGRITLQFDLQPGIKLRQLSRGLPDTPLLPLVACLVPPRLSVCTLSGGIGGYTGTPLVGVSTACSRQVRQAVSAGIRYTYLRVFLAYAAIAIGWLCGSPHAEWHYDEGRR